MTIRTKRPLRGPVREEAGPTLKNYTTPAGLQRLKDEHRFLLSRERPAVVEVVAWAASNGDRGENADCLYGKRRLGQIDSRIRFLTKRIGAVVVVDPAAPRPESVATSVFFGATVTYKDAARLEHVVSIVGIDEVDLDRGYISWRSPLANALMKASPGDRVVLRAPAKTEHSRLSTSSTRLFRWILSANRWELRQHPRSNAPRPSRQTLSVPRSLSFLHIVSSEAGQRNVYDNCSAIPTVKLAYVRRF